MAYKDEQRLKIPLLTRIAMEMGYDLVDVELVKEGPGKYLRIYIDKESGFTLDDCEAYHRRVQPELESIAYDFLEVSSPGVDRPLKTEKDYARALQTEVEVRLYKPIEGQKIVQGLLCGWDEHMVRIKTEKGEREIPRKAAALIRPVIHFDEDEVEENE